MTVNDRVLAAFAELQKASLLIGKEFKIDVSSRLTVLDVRMEVDASCDYSITAEYEIWRDGRMFCSGTRSYDSLLGMIGHDSE